ncbi:hypothetical protein [Corynebacterium sp. UBA2622]|uniref:hypothetical protein n=1 Tax=Corynebacterium sp. UBA2622 TaxID=1946393 RepID=UPI0025BE98FD|nr:hypothetical protein [Corynebacterium sp. UBA2622]
MSDSFSELRRHGGSNRPWVIGGLAVLVVAALAALGAAGWALTRPAEERNPIPRVVTVTAQPPAPSAASPWPAGTPSPGTYSGWLFSSSRSGESGWNAVLTVSGDSAMIAYLNGGCTALLTRADGGQWQPRALNKPCGATDAAWTLSQREPGVVEAHQDRDGNDEVKGSLSLGNPE